MTSRSAAVNSLILSILGWILLVIGIFRAMEDVNPFKSISPTNSIHIWAVIALLGSLITFGNAFWLAWNCRSAEPTLFRVSTGLTLTPFAIVLAVAANAWV